MKRVDTAGAASLADVRERCLADPIFFNALLHDPDHAFADAGLRMPARDHAALMRRLDRATASPRALRRFLDETARALREPSAVVSAWLQAP